MRNLQQKYIVVDGQSKAVWPSSPLDSSRVLGNTSYVGDVDFAWAAAAAEMYYHVTVAQRSDTQGIT